MSKVQLYVYDLSRGMAKSMSLMLTGKQIDGIWHTSVVVFGREIFFGQGILEAKPGTTHHGQPLQIIDCGTTHIDQDTFQEYLGNLQEMYTADAYHLIDFNCNHFTADVVGFLTGATIPAWISGLPAEFLSTPFGQQMRPHIDAMFRRTSPSEHRINGSAPAPLPTPPASGTATPDTTAAASAILNAVASRATAPPTPSPEVSPLALVSSVSHFQSILSQNQAVIVNFTNTPGCPPCRVIKPIYEALAANLAPTYASKGVQFVEVELGVGEGRTLASRHGVSATPTFQFFRDGKKVEELRGANKRELESKVETFLEDCFPRHPHRKIYLPALEATSLKPIQANAVPNYPTLLSKLESFAGANKAQVGVLRAKVIPLLEARAHDALPQGADKAAIAAWSESSTALLGTLQPAETFPVIDLIRVGLIYPTVAVSLFTQAQAVFSRILNLAASQLAASVTATPRPFLLTVLRMLTNLLASLELANLVLAPASASPLRPEVITILVESLLHPDTTVRSAAAAVAVNLSSWRHRLAKETKVLPEDQPSAEWEIELLSALLEAISREEDEEVAHRLLIAFALTLWYSPAYVGELKELLDVLNAKEGIESKVRVWKKKELKKLGEEVAAKIC